MDLLELLSAGSGSSQADILRNQRRGEESAALRAANQNAGRMDILAAASQMAANPGAAAAAKMSAGSQREQFAPVQMGQQGFMLPNEGQFVESPMFADEKREGRATRLQTAVLAAEERARRDQERRDLQRQMHLDRMSAAEREAAARRERHEDNVALRNTLAAIAQQRANQAGAGTTGGKTLPAGELRKIGDQDSIATTFADLATSFRDELAGTPGLAGTQNLLGKYQPMGIGSGYGDQANWWQNYNEQKNVLRNKLFGSALTKTEKEAFEKATITEGMAPAEIRIRLNQQHRAVVAARNKLIGTFRSGGYNVTDLGELPMPEALLPGATPRGRTTNVPGSSRPRAAATPTSTPAVNPPPGVSAAVWAAMPPEDKALFK